MSETSYNALLVAANLATYQNDRLSIKPKEWETFITEVISTDVNNCEEVTSIELTPRTQLDLPAIINGITQQRKNKKYYHCIRLGDKYDDCPDNLQKQLKHKIVPPKLNNLRSVQRTLGRVSERVIADALMENEDLFDAARKEVARMDILPDTKQHTKSKSTTSVSSNTTAKTSTSTPIDVDERPSKKAKVSPDERNVTEKLTFDEPGIKNDTTNHINPLLSKLFGAGFDASNPETRQKIYQLQAEISSLGLNGRWELNSRDARGHFQTYVRVPVNTSDKSFYNSKEWLDTCIKINSSNEEDPIDSARRIATHIIKYYEDAHMKACQEQDLPIVEGMSTTAYAALLKATNMSGAQEDELRKHMADHIGKNFLPSRSKMRMMCEGHTKIFTDTVEHAYEEGEEEETIDFNWKDLSLEVSTKLAAVLSSENISPRDVKRIVAILGGDHGGDAFTFGTKLCVHFHGAREPIYCEVTVCEVICRKDSAELLEKTLVEKMTPYIKKINDEQLWIYRVDQEVHCSYGERPANIANHMIKDVKTWLFVTGDLAFYAMALGRESMSGHWCFLCKLKKSMFASGDAGDHWTMEQLIDVANKVESSKNKKPQEGVKTKPWWPFIPLKHFMVPLLHVLIGIGNDLLTSFRDWVNDEVECLHQQEVRTRQAATTAEHKIIDYGAEFETYKMSPRGKRYDSIKNMIRYRKTKLERLGAIVNVATNTNKNDDSPVEVEELLNQFDEFVAEDDNEPLEEGQFFPEDEEFVDEAPEPEPDGDEMEDYTLEIPDELPDGTKLKIQQCQSQIKNLKEELEPLATERGVITGNLKRTRAYLKELTIKLKSFRKVRKKSDVGLETKMFRVLKSIGVELTRYHGGSLMGKDIKKVMDNASHIFDEFKKILKDGKRSNAVLDDDIDKKCEEYKSVFLLWDGAFSIARKVGKLEDDDINQFQIYVDAAVQAHKDVGCNITHKVHLMWKHVAWQMNELKDVGGLGDKMEDWVERAHQDGARRRRRFYYTRNAELRAKAAARIEHRDTKADVIAYQAGVDARHKKTSSNTPNNTKALEQKQHRIANRVAALNAHHSKMAARAEAQDALDNAPAAVDTPNDTPIADANINE